MILILVAVLVIVALAVGAGIYRSRFAGGMQTAGGGQGRESIYSLTVNSLEGEPVELSRFEGRVVMVVNVASKCGLTPQYEGLQALHEELGGPEFEILGFPSNDFMNQEPGSAEEIATFCERNYGVTFPMFEKVKVKGDDKHPLYRILTEDLEEPTWNFTKYLVDQRGHVVHRFAPKTEPGDAGLRQTIQDMIAQGAGPRS